MYRESRLTERLRSSAEYEALMHRTQRLPREYFEAALRSDPFLRGQSRKGDTQVGLTFAAMAKYFQSLFVQNESFRSYEMLQVVKDLYDAAISLLKNADSQNPNVFELQVRSDAIDYVINRSAGLDTLVEYMRIFRSRIPQSPINGPISSEPSLWRVYSVVREQ